jgi:hypothetical protein
VGCPSRDCGVGEAGQRILTAGERLEMPLEPWTFIARLCSYCGCVYSVDDHGKSRIHGHYDNALMSRGWRPAC